MAPVHVQLPLRRLRRLLWLRAFAAGLGGSPSARLKLVMVWVTTSSDSLVLTVGHYGPVRNGLHCKVVWLGLVLLGKQIGWFGLGLRRTASFPFTSRNKLSSVEGLQLIC